MIVIVVGMHRSGTSAVAGILHLNGIAMGSEKTFKPKPMPQNPRGFYENYDFRKLNDRILKLAGYRVKSFDTLIPQAHTNDRMMTKMGNLIDKQLSGNNHWGWKDPRTCLTLSEWLTVMKEKSLLNDTKVVFTTRGASAVAQSLRNRNGLHFDNGLILWRLYTERALEAVDKYSTQTFHFSFEDLLKRPQFVCEKLFQFLGTEYDPSIVEKFIDPSLNRSKPAVDIELSGEVAALTDKLQRLSSV